MTREEEIKKAYAESGLPDNSAMRHAFEVGFNSGRHPRWISVEEELPPKEEDVLVYNGHDYAVAWYDGEMWKTFAELPDTDRQVTYWMPLPTVAENATVNMRKGGEG